MARNMVTKTAGKGVAQAIRIARDIAKATGVHKEENEPDSMKARAEFWRQRAWDEATKREEVERRLVRAKRMNWHLVSTEDILEELERRQRQLEKASSETHVAEHRRAQMRRERHQARK